MLLRVTLTHAQVRQMQYDDLPADITRVKLGKSTAVFEAELVVWQRELRYAKTLGSFGGEWLEGNSRSANSAAGRITKAIHKAGAIVATSNV